MRWRATALAAFLCLPLWAQSGTGDSEVRIELSRLYAQIDSGFEHGRVEDALRLALPDAMVRHGAAEVRFAAALAQMRQAFQSGAVVKQRSIIVSLNVSGATAHIVRRSEVTLTMGSTSHSGVEQSEDTWVRTPEGWRLKLSVDLGSKETIPTSTPEHPDAILAEINRHAHPLDDVAFVADAIGDARVVALGEATHGTAEFSAARARMTEYLLTHMGFTMVAVEDNWTEVLAVDRYIKTGEGTAQDALSQLKGWPIRTRETLELVNAMRAINIKHPGKVTFAGFDMTWAEAAREMATAYARRAAPDQLPQVEKCYRDVIALGPRHPGPDANAKSATESARKVVDLFDNLKVSHDDHWRQARQAAEIVNQATAFRIEGQSPGYRDEMMARNVQWLCARERATERIVIWAHNGHISGDPGALVKPMGALLRGTLGRQYYAIGFAVAGGEVRAVGSKGLGVYTMPPAGDDAGEALLARSSLSAWFLDLRRLPEQGAAAAWFRQRHRFYTVGARWDEKLREANFSVFPMAESFEAIGFVREGHASSAP